MAYTDYAKEVALPATESDATNLKNESASELIQNPEKVKKVPKYMRMKLAILTNY